MSDQKEIVMVTPRDKFIASAKPKKITTLAGIEKNVYELPSGEFQHLDFSGLAEAINLSRGVTITISF
jgi:hypothetical protein